MSISNNIARKLTALAYEYSIDKEKETPYAAAASDEFNMIYRGGKKDDICVLVATVNEPRAGCEESSEPESSSPSSSS